MLSLRWVQSDRDLHAAQALRYMVFYEELGAVGGAIGTQLRRDVDGFDAICDHLLVVDDCLEWGPGELRSDAGLVVGTYRLLRQDVAVRNAGFYVQSEFNATALLDSKPHLRFLELGRSCVLKSQRSRPVIDLLWRGISEYVRVNQLDAILGCASLPGTDPDRLAAQLSYLAQNFAAAKDWRVQAHPDLYVEMNRLPRGQYDERRAKASLPPLIKGYLRAGARVGDGAVIDEQFNTTDVLIVLPLSDVQPRYVNRFDRRNMAGYSIIQPLIS